jgi:molybdate transport system permease protein
VTLRRGPGEAAARVLAVAAIALLAALLALPLVALFVRRPPGEVLTQLGQPLILDALRLSLVTSLAATACVIALGLPAAYVLATRRFPGKPLVELLIQLPMVLPPTVSGFALLLAFGRMGLAGKALTAFGISLPFTTLGVVVAQVFMSVPFFVLAARSGFESVDVRLREAAATLRAGEMHTALHVLLPIALPSLAAGATMACARAIGEFGATITFAGNMPGVTQTMPLAVYLALQTDLDAAITLSVVLVALAVGLLLGVQATGGAVLRPRSRA